MRIFVEERDLFLRERIAGAYRCAAWVKGGGEGVARGTQVRLAQSVARLCAPGLCGPAVAKRLERAEGRPCVPPLWSADAAAAAPIAWMEAATMRGPACDG